jgi:hypothetical protein
MSRKLAITAFDRYGEPVPCKAKICRGGTGLNTLRSWLDDAKVVRYSGANGTKPFPA